MKLPKNVKEVQVDLSIIWWEVLIATEVPGG